MKYAVIVGLGPNRLEIPLVVCRDVAAAQEYLQAAGLQPSSRGTNYYDLYDVMDALEQLPDQTANALFAEGSYYFGCGGCGGVQIKEFEMNTPMVVWNLD